jgi:hypothetical protein
VKSVLRKALHVQALREFEPECSIRAKRFNKKALARVTEKCNSLWPAPSIQHELLLISTVGGL